MDDKRVGDMTEQELRAMIRQELHSVLADILNPEQGNPHDEGSSANAPAKPFNLEDVRSEHPRAYEGWSDEEEQHLIRLVQEGRETREIAELLQRQPGAIRARREKLENRGLL
ncbi:MAG: hypothetical protein JXB30_02990 [Anaerolineae bacterium]|nr:hypothetical protein [Anaerolineae bacterium]